MRQPTTRQRNQQPSVFLLFNISRGRTTCARLEAETIGADVALLGDRLVVGLALGLVLLPLLGGGAALGNDLLLLAGAGLHGASLGGAGGGGVGVELLEGLDVVERVLLAEPAAVGTLGGVDHGLDLVGVDDTGEVGVDHGGRGDALAVLSVDGVEGLEGALGPDAEAAHVSSGGELEEVEAVDVAELDAGEVAEGLLDAVVVGVDDQRTATEGVAAVAHLALAGADPLGIGGLLDVGEGADGGEDVLGGRGLLGGWVFTRLWRRIRPAPIISNCLKNLQRPSTKMSKTCSEPAEKM